jgi:protein TonB
MRVQGPVQLEATVNKEGNITNLKVISGDAVLARAASEAVKQWRYKPYYLNGEPVEIQTQITVNFKLPN